MNKAEAIKLVQDTFTGDYSPASFAQFVTNLFKGEYTQLDKRRDGDYVREAFRSFVQGYRILGTYTDAAGSTLDVLEVTLHRNSSLDRARTAQRNFVADYLKKQGRDAALVAFLSPDQYTGRSNDWRFSLVKLEYALEVKDGKIKTEEELTPARRWSFLIGKHEGSHTVRSRFLTLLQDGEKPLLKELEDAFNIESVTDEFFKKYCELFFRMKESLDKLIEQSAAMREDFAARELTSVDFAKKTLGQMAFLYFLQKKGWFGVAPGKPWGTGPKDFLRQLFSRREKYGQNFFDDVLEPLFYEALAQDRGVEAIYPRLNNCRMPFLNGGLFEPMNGYSWETTEIRLPDELFSNTNTTAEGDIGDGILDIFDRYNFTVNENEPLEKEVAVDPEMLGKVFENLLEVKDRKSKGAFYTPREIVHFMCQESLINYLNNHTNGEVPHEDIQALIRNGSQIIQNDALVLEKGREGTYKFMLPETVRAKARELDHALMQIKVCDPAVGSGAFPLGMLTEIVQARQALAVHLRTTLTVYDLKLHSISHSIYGVDIDPGAVEIAKLRLWLALVVEENEPHPLPNLEHKIMQGNSLLAEFEGINLFDESALLKGDGSAKERDAIDSRLSQLQREYFALHSEGNLSPVRKFELEREIKGLSLRRKKLAAPQGILGQELTIFDASNKYRDLQVKAERLQKLIEVFISESRRSNKQRLKAEIEELKWSLIEGSLAEQGKVGKLAELAKLRSKNIRPFFVWGLEFSDVFTEHGGFDVVIANPPYGANIDDQTTVFERVYPRTTKSFKDIYKIFFELALSKLCSERGTISFITPNTFLGQPRYIDLRGYLLEHSILSIVNLGENVFEAVVPTAVIIAARRSPSATLSLNFADLSQKSKYSGSVDNIGFERISQADFAKNSDLAFSVDKMNFATSVPLSDVLDFKDAGINYQRVNVGLAEKGKSDLSDRLLYEGEQEVAEDRMYWKGSDIAEFFIAETTKRWVRVSTIRTLSANERVILNEKYFAKKPKLIWRQTAQFPIAAIDTKGIWFGRSVQAGMITKEYEKSVNYEYLVGLMNSSLFRWLYLDKVKEGGRVFPQVKLAKLKDLPVIIPSSEQLKLVCSLVDRLSSIPWDQRNLGTGSQYVEIKERLNSTFLDIYSVAAGDRKIIRESGFAAME